MLRRIYNKWRMPLYRDDVSDVIIKGLIGIPFAFLIGLMDSFLGYIDFPIGIGPLIVGIFIGRRIGGSYYNYHPLYPTIAVVFALISYVFYIDATYFMVYGRSFIRILRLFTYGDFYLSIVLTPYAIIRLGSLNDILFEVINIIIFCFMIYFSYRYSKGRH